MSPLYRFLFSVHSFGRHTSIPILVLRIFFGIMLMSHGIHKWAHFDTLSPLFPNPLGLGPHLTLFLAIFAELFCSIFIIFGFLFKPTLIPLIATMSTAFFMVQHASMSSGGELAFIYLFMLILFLFIGPGRLSFDYILSKKFN